MATDADLVITQLLILWCLLHTSFDKYVSLYCVGLLTENVRLKETCSVGMSAFLV